MENVIKLIHEFFSKGKLKYRYDEKTHTFSSGVDMENVLGNLRIVLPVRENSYTVYAILNGTPKAGNFGRVAEYLHRANYGMRNGNFEFDYRDGEIRYKTYVNFEGIQLSLPVVAESILIPILMFDQYGENLMRIMLGDGDPAELVKQAEALDEDDETSGELSSAAPPAQ
ncbi:MAG: YbjN domain-containing protein [Oscillospiraceae bacterium]|nr:YbjN domain-containing protein [Oscillospiraceae bacterium]